MRQARGAPTYRARRNRKNAPLGFACATRQPFELDQFLPDRFEILILSLTLGGWQVLEIECGLKRREAGVLVERRKKVVRFGGAGAGRELALDDLEDRD